MIGNLHTDVRTQSGYIALMLATIVGYLITQYFLIINEVEKLPKDLTWFGKLWKEFLFEYDKRWEIAKTNLSKQGIQHTTNNIDSSKFFGSGSQTYVHIIGDQKNPVLLMLPGYRCSSLTWAPHLDESLCQKYCVICLDYPFDLGRSIPGGCKDPPIVSKRGQNFTNFTKVNQSIDLITEWLEEVLTSLQVSQIEAIAGYSLGAFFACNFALQKPNLLRAKAKLFIAAPPATFSQAPLSTMLPIMKSTVWSAITGLPLENFALQMLSSDYSRELKAGTAETKGYKNCLAFFMSSSTILSLFGTTPELTVPIRMLSDKELKTIQDRFNPTYLCLEWDCFYHSEIAYERAKKLGINTIHMEKCAHTFCITQPENFQRIMYSVLM